MDPYKSKRYLKQKICKAAEQNKNKKQRLQANQDHFFEDELNELEKECELHLLNLNQTHAEQPGLVSSSEPSASTSGQPSFPSYEIEGQFLNVIKKPLKLLLMILNLN